MEEENHQSFPYLQLFGVVCASLIVSTTIFWVWHVVEMNTLRSANEKQNESVRAEIRILSEYISSHLGTSTETKS
jgi:hypothetical protein